MNQPTPTSISAPIGFIQKSGYSEIGEKLIRQGIRRRIYFSIKTIRNQVNKRIYLAKNSEGTDQFIKEIKNKGTTNIFLVIAYNTPWTVKLLLDYWGKNCPDLTLAVIDNSSSLESAKEIREICISRKTSYLKLPTNTAGHMCRSHGLAINWSWQNIICHIPTLNTIGYIDHDCIPIKPWSLSGKPNIFAYGAKNPGYIMGKKTWNLWAGFMIFDLSKSPIEREKMDFTVNPLDTLDTGGMNWRLLYRYLDVTEYNFASVKRIKLNYQENDQNQSSSMESEIIDDSFLHLGGLTHKKIWKDVDVEKTMALFESQILLIGKNSSHRKHLKEAES
jgi:hypothetical protein